MNNIGIIAGGGKLPIIIGRSLLEAKYNVIFFCINNFCDPKLYNNYIYKTISINSLTAILNILKKNKINKIIMAGHVKRPSIKEIKFDLNSIKLIKNFSLDAKGDDKLLTAISIFFKNEGFPTLDLMKECKELFVNKSNLTKIKPSKNAKLNLKKGLEFFYKIGKADIAQSLIIQNKIILGVEAAEGTDELIKRCFNYKKKGEKGVLIKFSKYNQNPNLDIPVIGLETLKNIKNYGYEGIYLEKHKCIIIEPEAVINFCNQNKIFISTAIKN